MPYSANLRNKTKQLLYIMLRRTRKRARDETPELPPEMWAHIVVQEPKAYTVVKKCELNQTLYDHICGNVSFWREWCNLHYGGSMALAVRSRAFQPPPSARRRRGRSMRRLSAFRWPYRDLFPAVLEPHIIRELTLEYECEFVAISPDHPAPIVEVARKPLLDRDDSEDAYSSSFIGQWTTEQFHIYSALAREVNQHFPVFLRDAEQAVPRRGLTLVIQKVPQATLDALNAAHMGHFDHSARQICLVGPWRMHIGIALLQLNVYEWVNFWKAENERRKFFEKVTDITIPMELVGRHLWSEVFHVDGLGQVSDPWHPIPVGLRARLRYVWARTLDEQKQTVYIAPR